MAESRTKRARLRTPEIRPQNGSSIEAVKADGNSRGRKKGIKEVKKLIDIGKEKGYLTYDELNDILPPDIFSADQIDDVMSIFGEMDIEVIDSNRQGALGSQAEESADDEENEKKM